MPIRECRGGEEGMVKGELAEMQAVKPYLRYWSLLI
jgi:hypothetical protein